MNCPNCGAPVRLREGVDSLLCEYCDSACVPEANEEGIRDLGEASELQCPVCKVALNHASMERHRMFYCARCRGTLVAMPVFVELVDELRSRRAGVAASHAADRHGLDRVLQCPGCGKRMDTHYYAGGGNVVIDDCSPCELVWLDAGEFWTIGAAEDGSWRYEGDGPNF